MSSFQSPRRAFTMGQLLVAIFVVAVVVAALIPAIRKIRDAQARVESINNLKTIALAFHGFHDKHKYLPYNGTTQPYVVDGVNYGGFAMPGDANTGSWAFQILPYIDQKAIFARRDPNVGVPVFMCLGRGRPILASGAGGAGAWTDYFLNSFINDPNGAWDVPNVKRTLVDIADGTSNTIMVGHGQLRPQDYGESDVSAGFTEIIFKGGSPAMCRPNAIVAIGRDSADSVPGNWGGPFPQGMLVGMGDGCIRMFPYELKGGRIVDGVCYSKLNGPVDGSVFPSGLGAFLTPTGGEVVTGGDM